MQILRQASFTSNPWKNGGGVTREAIRVPREGAMFRWRVSVAHIDTAGPFSEFADYHRRMVLLRGAGVRLTLGGEQVHSLSRVGDLVEFDGAVATDCELLDGPCVDLNLMTAKTLTGVDSWVESVDHPSPFGIARAGQIGLIFVVSNHLIIDRPSTLVESTVAASTHGALDPPVANDKVLLEPWDLVILQPGETAVVAAAVNMAAPLVFFATLDDNSPA